MATKAPNVWTLQDAKNRFSEVVRSAIDAGPQTVTRRGEPAVVIVSASAFEHMQEKRQTVYEFFRNSPLVGSGIDLTRQKDQMRDVALPDLPDQPES
jgi:prevent-host-death family protein